ncbi:lipoate--protein ligase [Treponema sp. OMZ 788]|uniref:lipoate--protein ligase n=1 Tax=unclassified Treponema TaxID=2638727 RepID=UPI0020A2D1A5|nr:MULTISPECIES: lipoate--protein ligase [unclassified Treponema]UTC61485.1 lipoate--protein ligase [Treponema sp. OMZ 787]UTC65536.1 lipoate--protein ligase [Treponema sp. OMZ 788]
MKYIVNNSHDPEYNMAFEEYCFRNLPLEDEEYVFLWSNSPTILLGKNQNTYQEINEKYINENGIKVVRRITGGGAIYQDLENINFSFVTKTKGNEKIDFKKYYIPIVNALKKIGVDAELSGRNDVTIDGQKCIGASQSVWQGRVLSDGSILFNVEMEALSKALTVRKEKLESKGVKSVRSRVTNIKPYLKRDITVDQFKDELLKAIFEVENQEPVEYKLSEEELEGVMKIYKERFSRKEWNYGASPKAEYSHYERFPIGSIEVFFNVENMKINSLKIHGDFFGTADKGEIEELLNGCEYSESILTQKLSDVDLTPYFGNIEKEAFIGMFFK